MGDAGGASRRSACWLMLDRASCSGVCVLEVPGRLEESGVVYFRWCCATTWVWPAGRGTGAARSVCYCRHGGGGVGGRSSQTCNRRKHEYVEHQRYLESSKRHPFILFGTSSVAHFP